MSCSYERSKLEFCNIAIKQIVDIVHIQANMTEYTLCICHIKLQNINVSVTKILCHQNQYHSYLLINIY